MKRTCLLRIVTLFVAACGLFLQTARADVLYDNSSNQTTNFLNPGTLEVGDEVILFGGNTITNFTFQYYASGLSGSATVQIRFYANDGSLVSGVPSPGAIPLWDSGLFSGIVNTNGGTLSYDLTGSPVIVPSDFTWTVQFSGANIGSGGIAGVPIFTPPTTGQNYFDYWENNGTSWVLKTNDIVDMNFAAQIQGVPEPSMFAFFALGGLGLFARLRRRS